MSAVAKHLLVDAADGQRTYAERDREKLLNMDIRKGGILEDSLADRTFDLNEHEERLMMKLEKALEDRETALKSGAAPDAMFDRFVEKLQSDVAKFTQAQPVKMNR